MLEGLNTGRINVTKLALETPKREGELPFDASAQERYVLYAQVMKCLQSFSIYTWKL